MKVRLERNRKNPMVLKKNDYFSALMHDPLSLDIRLDGSRASGHQMDI